MARCAWAAYWYRRLPPAVLAPVARDAGAYGSEGVCVIRFVDGQYGIYHLFDRADVPAPDWPVVVARKARFTPAEFGDLVGGPFGVDLHDGIDTRERPEWSAVWEVAMWLEPVDVPVRRP